MNSRERLNLALNHREADRVPFDLGATVLTSIHHKSYSALRQYLKLPSVQPRIVDIFQQIVAVDDDMRERLKVDVRDVAPRSSAAFRIEIKDMGDYTYFYDEWGIGWRMPKDGGWYYDMFDHPLKDVQTIGEIEK
jgi:uroporphyrinogen decarboxylase